MVKVVGRRYSWDSAAASSFGSELSASFVKHASRNRNSSQQAVVDLLPHEFDRKEMGIQDAMVNQLERFWSQEAKFSAVLVYSDKSNNSVNGPVCGLVHGSGLFDFDHDHRALHLETKPEDEAETFDERSTFRVRTILCTMGSRTTTADADECHMNDGVQKAMLLVKSMLGDSTSLQVNRHGEVLLTKHQIPVKLLESSAFNDFHYMLENFMAEAKTLRKILKPAMKRKARQERRRRPLLKRVLSPRAA